MHERARTHECMVPGPLGHLWIRVESPRSHPGLGVWPGLVAGGQALWRSEEIHLEISLEASMGGSTIQGADVIVREGTKVGVPQCRHPCGLPSQHRQAPPLPTPLLTFPSILPRVLSTRQGNPRSQKLLSHLLLGAKKGKKEV